MKIEVIPTDMIIGDVKKKGSSYYFKIPIFLVRRHGISAGSVITVAYVCKDKEDLTDDKA